MLRLLFLACAGLAAAEELPEGYLRSQFGVNREGHPLPCYLSPEDLDRSDKKIRVLLVGGLDGTQASSQAVLDALRWLPESGFADRIAFSGVPRVSAEGGFPPKGPAYRSEAQYLWRWIGLHAPDCVLEIQCRDLSRKLLDPLTQHAPSSIASIQAMALRVKEGKVGEALEAVLPRLKQKQGPSAAQRILAQRAARSPETLIRELGRHYGNALNIQYIPALAGLARIRHGDTELLEKIEVQARPYLDGKKSFQGVPNGGVISGHLLFAELARITGKDGYTRLVRRAAELAFDASGKPLEAMPSHNQMSDAVFMGGPILAEAGRLTGEARYYEQCLRHIRVIQRHCLREDGLYRHSPLDEAAWGRGNGFPALGLALVLSAFPKDHPERSGLVAQHRTHLQALLKHQDLTGPWRQVIDHPGSYREFTATCMITFAMVRGVREGWLERKPYEAAIDKAWEAIKIRIAPSGELVDVCTGTGKQKNLRAYLDRTAILGKDERGGAMALMVATEMAAWIRE